MMNKNLRLLSHIISVLALMQTTACGGGNSDSESAAVITTPAITAPPANTTVTELQPASFSVTATGGEPLGYSGGATASQ